LDAINRLTALKYIELLYKSKIALEICIHLFI